MKSMKKTAAKAFLVICACALIVFLLLPFLENTPATSAGSKKATPQIFTSNPLTSLVDRIAALFGNQRARQRLALAKKSQQPTQAEMPAAPTYASAHESTSAGGASSLGSVNQRFNYGEASIKNENGDWVLVRQTLPSGAYKGMHEVNATDDAYDSYVKQERTARFTPVQAKKPVPSSTLARFFQPIKNFFGFEENNPTPVEGSVDVLANEPEVAVLASSGRSGNFEMNRPNIPLPTAPENTNPLATLFDLDSAIEKAVDSFVDQQNPTPQTDAEKKENEQKRKDLVDQYAKRVQETFLKVLSQDAAGIPATDYITQTLGCRSGASSLYHAKDNCSTPPTEQTEEAAEKEKKEIKAAKKLSLEKIEQAIGEKLPPKMAENGIKMVIVLSKADPVLFAKETETQSAQEQDDSPKENSSKNKPDIGTLTREMYQDMLESKCAKQDCFWVGNKMQFTPELPNLVDASGVDFSGDPLGLYDKMLKAFQEKKIAELEKGETAQNSDEINAQINQLFNHVGNEEVTPYYVAYTKEELKQVSELNKKHESGKPPSSPFIFYSPTASIANELVEATGTPALLFYDPPAKSSSQSGATQNSNSPSKTSGTLESDANKSAVQRGETINKQLIARVALLKETLRDIKKDLERQGIQNEVQKIPGQIQKEAAKAKSAATQNKRGRTSRGR